MIRPVIATTRNMRIAEAANVSVTADRGSAPAEETSVCARSLVTMTTMPRAAVLISALIDSQMPWVPNMRLMPGKGLSFFSVGFIALVAKVTPPCAAEARVPTSIMPSPIGSTVDMKADSACPIRSESAPGSGFEAIEPIWMKSFRTDSNASPTIIGSSTLAVATPSHVPSSWVRGICPSLRAFFRRWGVGFSVFSPPGPSAAISRSGGRSSPAPPARSVRRGRAGATGRSARAW